MAQAVEKRLGWRMDVRTLFFQNLRQVVATAAAEKGFRVKRDRLNLSIPVSA